MLSEREIEEARYESPLFGQLMAARKWTPEWLAHVDDPTFSAGDLPGIEGAVSCLHEIHEDARPIVVIPDFDCDGVMSAVVGYAGLSVLGFDVGLYEPDAQHGYGFGAYDVGRIAERFPDALAVITCDVGITCVEGARAASDRGWLVIVTDHHAEPDDPALSARSVADAVVDPCAAGSEFPLPGICGAHVLWLVLREYAQRFDRERIPQIDALRAFAGIATVTDDMPLLHENRTIVRDAIHWCDVTRKAAPELRRVIDGQPEAYADAFRGLWAILDALDGRGKLARVDEDTFGFYVGPMVNSVKRLGENMHAAYGCFTGHHEYAADLLEFNDERKRLVALACDRMDRTGQTGIVRVAPAEVPAGMLGLVAGRVTGDTGLPCAVVLRHADGSLGGSCRSPEWFDIRRAINDVGGRLPEGVTASAAGHAGACGVSISASRFDSVRPEVLLDEALEPLARSSMPKMPDGTPDVAPRPDVVCRYADVAQGPLAELGEICDGLAPFGHGFERPRVRAILSPDAFGAARTMGKDGGHLRVDGLGCSLVCWNQADMLADLGEGGLVIDGRLSDNVWRGRVSYQVIGTARPATAPDREYVCLHM